MFELQDYLKKYEDFNVIDTDAYCITKSNMKDQLSHWGAEEIAERSFINALWITCSESGKIISSDNFAETGLKHLLEAVQYEVEKKRRLVDAFLFNRAMLGNMKHYVNAIDFDPITDKDKLVTEGIFGSLWGVNITIITTIPHKTIFSIEAKNTLGYYRVEGDILEIGINPDAVAVATKKKYIRSKLEPLPLNLEE